MGIFNSLFGTKKEEEQQLEVQQYHIDLNEHGIAINEHSLAFPVPFSSLEHLLGKSRKKINEHNTIYTWDNLGVHAYSKDGLSVEEVDFQIFNEKDAGFLPAKNFQGKLTIQGKDYQTVIKISPEDYRFKELKCGDNDVFVSLTKHQEVKQISGIGIYKSQKREKIKSDKYKFKKVAGEKIEFADFNFKLAVIEELMYNKELLKPRFDVYEFVKTYDQREIDIEEEGYELIPEVVNYFKELEIDINLAAEVTEIYQDGGNNIYGQLCPFWDGEDETFDIRSYEDVKYFPNLKKMTLLCTDQQVFDDLNSRGIAATAL